VFELKCEWQDYFQENSRPDLANCFEDEKWLEKLVYLADISHHIIQLNRSPQGPGGNVLASSDKILWFKRKLNHWKNHIVKGNLEMCPLPLGLESEEEYQQVSSLIKNHVEQMRNKIKHYFPSLSTQVSAWVRNL
jgi:hypothetical protein